MLQRIELRWQFGGCAVAQIFNLSVSLEIVAGPRKLNRFRSLLFLSGKREEEDEKEDEDDFWLLLCQALPQF